MRFSRVDPSLSAQFLRRDLREGGSYGLSAFDIPDDIVLRRFTAGEYKYIADGPGYFGLYKEERRFCYFPLAAFVARKDFRAVMEEIRLSGGGGPIGMSDFRGRNEGAWVVIRAYLG